MVKRYETVFILTPVLSEEQLKSATDEYQKLLKSNGAEIVAQENWGLKKLAYPIQKKSTGFYNAFEFSAGGEIIDTLELAFRRDERILRFLTMKLDKHAVAFNIKRRVKEQAKADAAPKGFKEKKPYKTNEREPNKAEAIIE